MIARSNSGQPRSDCHRKQQRFGPIEGFYFDEREEYVAFISSREAAAYELFKNFLSEHGDVLSYASRQGDGQCGNLVEILKESLLGRSLPTEKKYKKKKMDASFRTAVFERDAYRCVSCGSHIGLCVDHVHPEVLGGEATMDNCQTLCRGCNSSKGARTEWLGANQ